MEITLGLLFAGSIAGLFAAFPQAIVGAMMFMVGLEMVKSVKHVKVGPEIVPLSRLSGWRSSPTWPLDSRSGIIADRHREVRVQASHALVRAWFASVRTRNALPRAVALRGGPDLVM